MVTSKQVTVDEEYVETRPKSRELYQKARGRFPGGVTHDARYFQPFPLYVTHALGSKKWDVDGHEYIDYWSGHGALMLGHNHPALLAAATEQLQKGTHYGACHALEVQWADLVMAMVPGAERVKFVSSGTEATMLAMRLARGFTGRTKILKFQSHFHGWNDYAVATGRPALGVPKEVQNTVGVLPANDMAAVRSALSTKQFAAVILEPAGAGTFKESFLPGFQAELRLATKETGTVLIFDEVVTGFRLAPGGAQEYFGVTADLCTFAKALVGGLPGGAVSGRRDILDGVLEFSAEARQGRAERMSHPGTFNANPLAAAMAVANLTILSQGRETIYRRVNDLSATLRAGMNEAIKKHGLPGCVYGASSRFHTAIDPKFADLTPEIAVSGTYDAKKLAAGMGGPLAARMRRALILNGVDPMGMRGLLTAAHSQEDIEKTVAAFDQALGRIKAEGSLGF